MHAIRHSSMLDAVRKSPLTVTVTIAKIPLFTNIFNQRQQSTSWKSGVISTPVDGKDSVETINFSAVRLSRQAWNFISMQRTCLNLYSSNVDRNLCPQIPHSDVVVGFVRRCFFVPHFLLLMYPRYCIPQFRH